KRYGKLNDIAPLDLETITAPGDVAAALADGLKIEAAAWKGEAGTAIICDPEVQEFYTRLAIRGAERGVIKLVFLRAGGKRIAFPYVLEPDGIRYALKIGYDTDYGVYSPGNLMRDLILREACESGYREYDFLGVPDDWKLAWTREARDQHWLYLFRRSWRCR